MGLPLHRPDCAHVFVRFQRVYAIAKAGRLSDCPADFRLDHDDLGSDRSKIVNAIDFNTLSTVSSETRVALFGIMLRGPTGKT